MSPGVHRLNHPERGSLPHADRQTSYRYIATSSSRTRATIVRERPPSSGIGYQASRKREPLPQRLGELVSRLLHQGVELTQSPSKRRHHRRHLTAPNAASVCTGAVLDCPVVSVSDPGEGSSTSKEALSH